MKKVIKNYLFALTLPFLFGLFPLLFLFAQNAKEMVIFGIFMPLLLAIGFSIVVTTVFGFLLKSFFKSALIAALLLFSYFSYGHILGIMPDFHLSLAGLTVKTGHFLLLFWAALLVPLVILIIRTRSDCYKLVQIFTLIGSFLVLIQVVQAGSILLSRKKIQVSEETTTAVQVKKKYLPDIYYIVLDAFAGNDILKEIYGVDNTYFINYLKGRGFYVPEISRSHYCQTIFSLGAVLNMNYIGALGDFDESSSDRIPMITLLKNNQVLKYVKGAGYSTVAFSSGYLYTEFKDADLFLKPSGSMSEFENVLLTTTLFPFNKEDENSAFSRHRKRILYTLNKVPNITEVDSPKFVFAHIVSPHPPFVFDENGQPVQYGDSFNFYDGSHYRNSKAGHLGSYVECYGKQVTYLAKLLIVMIDKLFEQYPEQKPVIILMADHGPGSELSWTSLAGSNVKERFSILNAYYFPNHEGNDVYENVMPINLFRVIFNLYLGTRLKMLPEKSYFAVWARPYRFYDVTEQLLPVQENDQVTIGK